MNRFFTLIVTCILFVLFTSFFQNGVTIEIDAPDIIEAGTEITVNVTIRKGNLSGFARFQQDLPYGFTALALNSANADFSFQDQKVRLIWLRVPDDDKITFSYIIIANERLKGSIDLNGRFSYIDNNERKTVDTQPRLLAINPSQNANSIDVHEYSKLASIEAAASMASRSVALRQQPVWMEEDKMYLVTLLINKDAVQFAKIEETVPNGFTAACIDCKGGLFTFKNKVAQIIWRDLPADPYFTVTYKLIPNDGKAASESMHLSGVFTYMSNNKTLFSTIVERNESFAGINREQVNDILRNVKVQVNEQPVQIASLVNDPNSGKSDSPKTGTKVDTSMPSTGSTIYTDNNDILAPGAGVYYRVQIAAGHKPVNVQRYFNKYKLEYVVMKEQHEGWIKYSVGPFNEYKNARDYRVHLGNTTTLNDAFIAAYNNGKRITVQDALMTLNQKWYK